MDKYSLSIALAGFASLLVGLGLLFSGSTSATTKRKRPNGGTTLPGTITSVDKDTGAISGGNLGSISDSYQDLSDYSTWLASLPYTPPPAAAPYLNDLFYAETKNRIPPGLLVALIQRESAFVPTAYNKSSGASGIAQIIPKWHPDVNPWKPSQAIRYAGEYLRENFDRFGSWRAALAAYNWGPTALANYGMDNAPQETRDYVAWIMAKAQVA